MFTIAEGSRARLDLESALRFMVKVMSDSAAGMNIRAFAERTGLSAHTLRYYEKIGLMPQVKRSRSGQRRYSDEDAARVSLVQCFKATGMPLKEVQRFAQLERRGDATLRERLELLRAHEHSVQAQRAELERQHAKLRRKIAHHEKLLQRS